MKVEIVEKYKGEEKRDTITIWGDNGFLCRPYVTTFELSKYYMIALYDSSTDDDDKEESRHYFVSGCGAYWLSVNYKQKTVFGDINSEHIQKTSVSINNFKLLLTNNNP